MSRLKKLYENTVGRVAPSYEQELEASVVGCTTLLDVGCGAYSPIGRFTRKSVEQGGVDATGVDAFAPSIERSRAAGLHRQYVQMDILKIAEHFASRSFDCVLASDVIEHLTKEDGFKLLDQMEQVASKRVIVFTPNGFVPQGEYDKNPWQVHISGWTADEFERRGYTVYGMGGAKPLKGEYGRLKFKPAKLWYLIADLTQPFVRRSPSRAYQLLAIKEIA